MTAVRRIARIILVSAAPGLALACSRDQPAGEVASADTASQNPSVSVVPHEPSSDSVGSGGGAKDPMAGMGHGTMAGMEHSSSAASAAGSAHAAHDAGPGSDPGARSGRQTPAADHGAMKGMDHSAMASGGRSQTRSTSRAHGAGMPGMDHTGAVRRPQNQVEPMQGMVHNADQPDVGGDARATAQLRTLVQSLLQDPQVRAALQQDTALARRWSNEAVRRRLTNPGS